MLIQSEPVASNYGSLFLLGSVLFHCSDSKKETFLKRKLLDCCFGDQIIIVLFSTNKKIFFFNICQVPGSGDMTKKNLMQDLFYNFWSNRKNTPGSRKINTMWQEVFEEEQRVLKVNLAENLTWLSVERIGWSKKEGGCVM